jgi:uncharacterized protein (TIGR02266 family)
MGIDIDIPLTQGVCKRLKSEMRVYYGTPPQTVLSDFSVDLSTGGLYLKTKMPLGIDDDLMLTFSLPGQEEKSVSCDARVAWVNQEENPLKPELPSGVGVQFIDLTPEDLASIASCLDIEAIW